MFDFLFDSNSVRDFARRIPDPTEWDLLWAAWKKSGFKSAWIPWTIGEVIGTNLAGETRPVTDADCVQTALAVRRFDRIAGRDILIGPRLLTRWSISRYLGLAHGSPFEERHRKSLDAAKTLQSASQVSFRKSPELCVVYIRDTNTGDLEGQTIPTDFVESVERRVAHWKERMERAGLRTDYKDSDVVQKEALLDFLWKETPKNVVHMAKQVGFSDKAIHGFEGKFTAEILSHPFVYGAVAQDWYHILRVVNVKTGKILETLGRDLVIANYIPLTKTFVTSDVDFAKLVQNVLPANVMNFDAFRKNLLTS